MNISNEIIYFKFGSTYSIDIIYMFLIVPMSSIGFILNVLSFIVLTSISSKSKSTSTTIILFKYLKVYTLNAIVINIYGIGCFTMALRLNGIMIDYFSRLFKCFLLTYHLTSTFLYGNLLDLVICHDRLSMFIKSIAINRKRLRRPYLEMFIIFLAGYLLNLPHLFRFKMRSDEETFDPINLNNATIGCCRMWIQINSILMCINILIRDLLPLSIEIWFSLMSFIYFRRFIQKKRIITSTVVNMNNSSNKTKSIDTNDDNEINVSLFTFIRISMSILCNLMVIVSDILFEFNSQSFLTFYLLAVAILFISIKSTSNFFILFYFNKCFKREFKRLFQKTV